jgi:polyphenol oxidase
MFAWRALAREPGASPGAVLTVPELARHGIEVAFTTRLGGRSGAPFASLNLSYSSGDDPEVVRRNRGRALAAIGGSLQDWTGARQVHSDRAVRIGDAERGAGWASPTGVIADADALWTDRPGPALVVLTADCTPILLADTRSRRIGTVHAGWRGLLGGIVERTVEAMGDPEHLTAFVGPSIGPCHYEIGSDVSGPARDALGDVVRTVAGREHLDLWAGSLIALARAGVREVWPAALCTRCEPDRFYSHRAGARGRQGLLARIAA